MSEGEKKQLMLYAIVKDPQLQARNKIDKGTVEKYAAAYEAGAEMPPIIVAMVNDMPVLLDGWHRTAALKSLRRLSVEAIVTESSRPDAVFASMVANLKHGLPLKPTERNRALRKALGAYISARRHLKGKGRLKSFREIAADFENNVSHTTIRRWLRKDHPKIASRYGDGEPYVDNGGIRPITPSVFSLNSICRDSIENTVAAFQGITEPEERGEIIEMMVDALRKMKEGGEWVIIDNEF